MSRPLRVKWQNSVEELEEAYKQEKNGKVKIRLYALWKISEGNAAKSMAVSRGYSYSAVLGWLRRYKTEGLTGLKDKKSRGRKSQLFQDEISELQDSARKGELATPERSRIIIESRYNVSYKISGVWRLFRRINLRWKVLRPKHIKGDSDKQEAFKKRGSLTM